MSMIETSAFIHSPPQNPVPRSPPGAPPARPGGGSGKLRSGNPQGNPNAAPQCGAKNRAGGACRAPALRGHARCRNHGGHSTGPSTEAGLARLAAAHTTHGRHTAAVRARDRHVQVMVGRSRVLAAVLQHRPWLPPALVEWALTAPELDLPEHPSRRPVVAIGAGTPCALRRDARGRFLARASRFVCGRAAERVEARAEAASLAPWKAAIAGARAAKRQARQAGDAQCGQDLMNREDGGDGMRWGGDGGRRRGAACPAGVVSADFDKDLTESLPPGALLARPGGGTVASRVGHGGTASGSAGPNAKTGAAISARTIRAWAGACVAADMAADMAAALARAVAGVIGTLILGAPTAQVTCCDKNSMNPGTVRLRARLLDGTHHDGRPFWGTVEGGMPALLAIAAAGGDTKAAVRAIYRYEDR